MCQSHFLVQPVHSAHKTSSFLHSFISHMSDTPCCFLTLTLSLGHSSHMTIPSLKGLTVLGFPHSGEDEGQSWVIVNQLLLQAENGQLTFNYCWIGATDLIILSENCKAFFLKYHKLNTLPNLSSIAVNIGVMHFLYWILN